MPNLYDRKKSLPPLQVVSKQQVTATTDLQPWKDGALLHTLKQASEILGSLLGDNYSESQLRTRITSGLLGEAGEIWFFDGSYKINIHNFLEWRKAHPDEKALKRRLKSTRL